MNTKDLSMLYQEVSTHTIVYGFTYMIAFMVIGIKFLCYSQKIFVLSFLPTLKDIYAFYPFIVQSLVILSVHLYLSTT